MKRIFYFVMIFALASVSVAKDLPLPEVPSTLRVPAQRADYVGAHFWDAMDFTSPDALDAAGMSQNVANFLSVFPLMSGDSARTDAADRAMAAAMVSEDAAALLSQTVEDYLFPKVSPMRDERLYTIFLKSMLKAGYPDSVRVQWMLEMTAKNMPGTKAADFTFTDREGQRHTLVSSLGKATLLFFYDPDCDICHAAASELASDIVLATRIGQGRAAVIAINPGELDEWRESPGDFPAEWIVGCDDGEIDAGELYLISEYPEFYLLAPDGTVILKNEGLPRVVAELMKM